MGSQYLSGTNFTAIVISRPGRQQPRSAKWPTKSPFNEVVGSSYILRLVSEGFTPVLVADQSDHTERGKKTKKECTKSQRGGSRRAHCEASTIGYLDTPSILVDPSRSLPIKCHSRSHENTREIYHPNIFVQRAGQLQWSWLLVMKIRCSGVRCPFVCISLNFMTTFKWARITSGTWQHEAGYCTKSSESKITCAKICSDAMGCCLHCELVPSCPPGDPYSALAPIWSMWLLCGFLQATGTLWPATLGHTSTSM